MNKKDKTILFKDHLPKMKKLKLQDLDVEQLGKEGVDFIKFCEANNVSFDAFFVAFNIWLNLPFDNKQAVIVQLIKDGKVTVGDDVRKDSKSK